jgi:DNA polymerase theta
MATIYGICDLLKLPKEIGKAYELNGLRNLYPWQHECLALFLNHSLDTNLIYRAPTSGGKSFIAELFLLRSAIANGQKALLVLPYVSMVIEKQKYFKRLLRLHNRNQTKKTKLKVRAVFADHGGYNIYEDRIIIATIEKGNRILNDLVSMMLKNDADSNQLRGRVSLGCVVVDEVHNVGSDFNGYLLEILMIKVLMLKAKFASVQLIGMSATISNTQELATWVSGRLFETDFRPIPLQECIVAGNKLFDSMHSPNSHRMVIPSSAISNPPHEQVLGALCVDALASHQQVLIFCPTKKECSDCCQQLFRQLQSAGQIKASCFAKGLNDQSLAEIIASRQKLQESLLQLGRSPTNIALSESVGWGLAFHNSNLGSNERELIEKAYKAGVLSILAATSTLAAGVNLPAGCVIILSLALGKDKLDVMHYRQMCGRAGRAGQCARGVSYLVVKESEKESAFQLLHSSYPRVMSKLGMNADGGNAMLKAIIEAVELRLCCSTLDIENFVMKSLYCHQHHVEGNHISESTKVSEICVQHLLSCLIIIAADDVPSAASYSGIRLSRFGRAIVKCGVDPDEAVVFYEALVIAREGLFLDVPLHLLYLVSPLGLADSSLYPDFRKLMNIYNASNRTVEKRLKRVFDAIGVDYGMLAYFSSHQPSKLLLDTCFDQVKRRYMISTGSLNANACKLSEESWKVLSCCRRLWLALITSMIIEGVPIQTVKAEFQCSDADIIRLRKHTIITASTIRRLCAEIGWTPLARLIDNFKKSTLCPTESNEVYSLMLLNECKGKEILTERSAKALFDGGISSIEDLSCQTIDQVWRLLDLRQGFEPRVYFLSLALLLMMTLPLTVDDYADFTLYSCLGIINQRECSGNSVRW